MNVADTERARTRLRAAGFHLTESTAGAEMVLFNTCSVRERAAHKVLTRIGEVKAAEGEKKLLIGVMGCVAQLEGESLFDHSNQIHLIAGTRATDRLPDLIRQVAEGERRVIDLGERAEDEFWEVSPVERHSAHVAFVPIIEGCNKFCTYCIVPFSRGRERSRPATEIIREILDLKSRGYKEVHLIGQNVNSYRPSTSAGLEEVAGATPFSRLLRAVAATGIERIKFTTSFPRDLHEDIVAALDEHENLCDWVHLPVQSGSNRILRAMRRGYTVERYLQRVGAIRRARRNLSLTSDIIIGFPGETDEDFRETVHLVEQCQYDGLYIFKYSVRPGTPAARLADDVSREVKRERFMELESLHKGIQSRRYQSYLGKCVSVLVEGESAKSEKDLTGHSTCQKVVNFPGDKSLVGQIRSVLIEQAKTNSLYGRLL